MSYNLCFICLAQIQRYLEFPSKKQSAAGTLCELLQLPLRDSTFTFGHQFLQAPYCPACVQKMTEFREMMKNLKELEIKIQEGRKHVENQLKESCEKRKVTTVTVTAVKVDEEDEDDYNENSFNRFDKFREDVLREINSVLATDKSHSVLMHTSLSAKNPSSKQFPLVLDKTPIVHLTRYLSKNQKRPGPLSKTATAVASSYSSNFQSKVSLRLKSTDSDAKQKPKEIEFVPFKQISESKKMVKEELEDDIDIEYAEYPNFSPEDVVVDNDNFVDPDSAARQQSDSGPKSGLDGLDTTNCSRQDPISVGFISIISPADPIIVDLKQEYSDIEMDNQADDNGIEEYDTEDIYVQASADGGFLCPYAPECKSTFQQVDRTEFLSHVQVVHEGKVPNSSETFNSVNSNEITGIQGKRYTCKFCSESYAALKKLREHHTEQHEDQEWSPIPRKYRQSVKSNKPRINRKRKRGCGTSLSRVNSGGRIYKCEFCEAAYEYSSILDIHRRKHTGQKPYKCKFCPEAFIESRLLRLHTFKFHEQENPQVCSQCGKKYAFQYLLNLHISNVHNKK